MMVNDCQQCVQLPPPPPIFSIGPPPNFLAIDIFCPTHLPNSSMKPWRATPLSISIAILLGILILLTISTITIFILIKKRRRNHLKQDCHPSLRCNEHLRHDSPKFLPLLSDSCSSDHMSSTPTSDSLTNADIYHQYEQIAEDRPTKFTHDCCLVYCRACANYHQLVPSTVRYPLHP